MALSKFWGWLIEYSKEVWSLLIRNSSPVEHYVTRNDDLFSGPPLTLAESEMVALLTELGATDIVVTKPSEDAALVTYSYRYELESEK